jgi:hypothetical protein
MRNRSTTLSFNLPGRDATTYQRVWDNPNGVTRVNSPPSTSVSFVPFTTVRGSGTISDVIGSKPPEVRINPKTGRWQRIKYPRPSPVIDKATLSRWEQGNLRSLSPLNMLTMTDKKPRPEQILKPIHPCIHTKSVVHLSEGNPSIVNVTVGELGFMGGYTDSSVQEYDNFATLVKKRSSTSSLLAAFDELTHVYTIQNYHAQDWFALMSDFDEACNSFIPSSFMLGEDIQENDIFIDAFKAVFQPTHAIKDLIHFMTNHVKGFRKKTLGHVARQIARDGSNSWLSYNLGFKPALKDISDALGAHVKVDSRMRFLSDNAGSFIPIRVRHKIASDFSNSPQTRIPGAHKFYISCAERTSTGTISAMGRVREDLNFGDTWSAYLQYFGINKIVGLAWELVPCSFVVDWIGNVKERINYYTRLRTGGPFTEFRGLCSSLKESTKYNLCWLTPAEAVAPKEEVVCAIKEQSTYSRNLSIPDTSGIVDLSMLGLFHGVTAGSLLIQRYL